MDEQSSRPFPKHVDRMVFSYPEESQIASPYLSDLSDAQNYHLQFSATWSPSQ